MATFGILDMKKQNWETCSQGNQGFNTYFSLCLSSFLTSETSLSVLGFLVQLYQQINTLEELTLCTWCSAGKWDLWASDLFAPSPLVGKVILQGCQSSTLQQLFINTTKIHLSTSEHKHHLNRIIFNFMVPVRHEIDVKVPLTKINKLRVVFGSFCCVVE